MVASETIDGISALRRLEPITGGGDKERAERDLEQIDRHRTCLVRIPSVKRLRKEHR